MAAQAQLDVQRLMQAWTKDRRSPWGTPIPKTAVPVTAFGSVVVPVAFGTQAVVTSYTAKPNWTALITGLVAQFAGTGPAPNPGDVAFQVDIDKPLLSQFGYILKDYGAVPFTLGSLTLGPPWPVEWFVRNGETLRLKATPVAAMGLGAGNFFTGVFVGFEWATRGYEGG